VARAIVVLVVAPESKQKQTKRVRRAKTDGNCKRSDHPPVRTTQAGAATRVRRTACEGRNCARRSGARASPGTRASDKSRVRRATVRAGFERGLSPVRKSVCGRTRPESLSTVSEVVGRRPSEQPQTDEPTCEFLMLGGAEVQLGAGSSAGTALKLGWRRADTAERVDRWRRHAASRNGCPESSASGDVLVPEAAWAAVRAGKTLKFRKSNQSEV
jgi:hypothetical protein